MRKLSCALVAILALVLAGCGGSGPASVAKAPPAAVGKGACLLARSTALEILARGLGGGGPMSVRLRTAERQAAGTLRAAAREISALEAASGASSRAPNLARALAGGAARLSYLASRVRSVVQTDALAQYSAAGQMIYNACE